MSVRYATTLFFCGTSWFIIAAVLGESVPILGKMWLQHYVAAVFTAYVLGLLLKKPLRYWEGWPWYGLPFVSLILGISLFGFLLPCSWLLTAWVTGSGGGVDADAFYTIPLTLLFYSMTYYIIMLYPLAFITQWILRGVMLSASKTPACGIK
jgi:hypothetical protein